MHACRFCGAPLEHRFVDLGMSPLCESYLEPRQLDAMEPFYPLQAYVCGGCLLVQLPEYVGARQKKFAWIIGLTLATIVFILLVVVNAFSPITGISCLICLVFLFFESAFGICLGCKFYSMIYKEKAQYCPGEICDVKSKQDIQKISRAQLLVVFGFVAYMVLAGFLFNDSFSKKPYDLFGIYGTTQSK